MVRIARLTEAEFTRQVIGLAKLHGWAVAHFRPACSRDGQRWFTAVQGDGVGFPDLILVRERIVVAELKVGRNQPTAAQVEWLERFAGAKAEAYLWRPDDWTEIERVLGGGR